MSRHDPGVLLRHMLDAAEETRRFMAGRDRQSLDTDRMLALAVVKSIEVIGEAARGVPRETRLSLPGIPWDQIIGMRHRLVHDYSAVNFDNVWQVVSVDIPDLIGRLEKAIKAF